MDSQLMGSLRQKQDYNKFKTGQKKTIVNYIGDVT